MPTFVFLKQHIEKIKRETTIVEAFLENHIKELQEKMDSLKEKTEKAKKALSFRLG